MNILITNDDGIFAKGLAALVHQFMGENNIVVVAPDCEKSGASHSITLTNPLRLRRETIYSAESVEAYRLNGTPADCVIVGGRALGIEPDVVISGVNHGYNLGTDVHYSGTVSAAAEGALLGIPSLAVSMCAVKSQDFSVPARVACEILPDFLKSGSLLYNLNLPDLPYNELRGVKYTGLSGRVYYAPFEKRVDPRNQEYFWWPRRLDYNGDMEADNDERWTREGYATVTPLSLNSTDWTALSRARGGRQHGK